jgi:hypothetical protein
MRFQAGAAKPPICCDRHMRTSAALTLACARGVGNGDRSLRAKPMEAGQPNRTAQSVAIHRAEHQLYDPPHVLNDPLALWIVGPEGAVSTALGGWSACLPAPRAMRAFIAARSRYVLSVRSREARRRHFHPRRRRRFPASRGKTGRMARFRPGSIAKRRLIPMVSSKNPVCAEQDNNREINRA